MLTANRPGGVVTAAAILATINDEEPDDDAADRMADRMTTRQVARYAGVHLNTVHEWVRAGKLTVLEAGGSHKSHMFSTADVADLVSCRSRLKTHSSAGYVPTRGDLADPRPTATPDTITTREIAARAGVDYSAVLQWARAGRFTTVAKARGCWPARYDRDEALAWLRERARRRGGELPVLTVLSIVVTALVAGSLGAAYGGRHASQQSRRADAAERAAAASRRRAELAEINAATARQQLGEYRKALGSRTARRVVDRA